MKRMGDIYEFIAERDNLRLAFWKATRGKRARPEVLAYRQSLGENLERLREQLLTKRWDMGHYHFFTVHDPKERTICAASFPERVLHHAVMNICEPVLERYAIHDSYACRTGKGSHKAVLRAQTFCRRFRWYLKLDVRKYFDSIDQAILLRLLERRFKDRDLMELFAAILATYETAPYKGLPIGNLVSQHLANFYLGGFDHWIKEVCRIVGYIRYMDDFVAWGDDRQSLRDLLGAIGEYLQSELGLSLKDNVQLNRTARGLPFLGYRVFPGCIRLAPRSKRRFTRHLREYEGRYLSGEWSERDLQRHMEPVIAFARFADTDGFRKQVLRRFGRVA